MRKANPPLLVVMLRRLKVLNKSNFGKKPALLCINCKMNMLWENRPGVERGTTLYGLKKYAPPSRIQVPLQGRFSGLDDTRAYHYLIYAFKRLPQLNAANGSKIFITNKHRTRQKNVAFTCKCISLRTQRAFSLLFHISIALVV